MKEVGSVRHRRLEGHMRPDLIWRLGILALTIPSQAATQAAAQAAPARWFVAEMRQLVTQPGVWWVTDNAVYRGPNEPFVRYATHWTTEDDGWTVAGRLVAVDTAGNVLPMWSYRMFWHPGEGQGYLMQTSSWGAYATGPMRLDSTAASRTILNDQDSWQPGGAAARSRHRSWFADADTHLTESFTWRDGAWVPHRTYRWVRQSFDPAPGPSR